MLLAKWSACKQHVRHESEPPIGIIIDDGTESKAKQNLKRHLSVIFGNYLATKMTLIMFAMSCEYGGDGCFDERLSVALQ